MSWGSRGWTGGRNYVEVMLRSISAVHRDQIETVVITSDPADNWNGLADTILIPNPGQSASNRNRSIFFRLFYNRMSRLAKENRAEKYCRENNVDALFLLSDYGVESPTFRRIAWIPDFQHRSLPRFFSSAERERRDSIYAKWAKQADFVMVSSESVRSEFIAFAPDLAHKVRVLRFPSLYAFEPPPQLVGDAPERYHLPDKFVLVANQYWAHKNHQVVIEAAAFLKASGYVIPMVFTGLPLESRDPTNAAVSRMLQAIAENELATIVIPLGLVPRADLTDLMRKATVILQPSRAEGWSTVVQDSLSLGRPVICSDIPVHREQAPDALGFFGCDDAIGLATLLRKYWAELRPGPDMDAERLAAPRARQLALTYGKQLIELVDPARQI